MREGKKEGSSQSIQKGKGVTVTVLVEREKLRSETTRSEGRGAMQLDLKEKE